MEHKPPTNSHLGEVVAEALNQSNITLRQASERTSIPLTTLHRRIRSGSGFTLAETVALAGLLDVAASELVARAERRSSVGQAS